MNGGTRELKFFTSPNSITGDMKLVKVYNSMLSDDEVKQNYNHVVSTIGGEVVKELEEHFYGDTVKYTVLKTNKIYYLTIHKLKQYYKI